MSPAFPATAVSPGAILELPHLQQPVREADSSSMICPECDARVNPMSSGFGAPCPGWELVPHGATAQESQPQNQGGGVSFLLEVNGAIRYTATNCLNKQPYLSCTTSHFFFSLQSLCNFPLEEAHILSAVPKFSFIICHFPLG